MPAENIIERSFSGGEISPALYARTDHIKYTTGLRTARNQICMRHGGVTQRPGTMYVGTALNGGNAVRQIPFIFNETGNGQSYVLEFGNLYVAFYQNGGNVILSTKIITGITQANPAVVTATAHGFSNGDIVTLSGILGMVQLNNGYFIIANVTVNTFSLKDLFGNAINSTSFGSYISGGIAEKIYIIGSPYLQADLPLLKFAESADVITIVHHSYAPRELRRIAPTNWTFSTFNFGPQDNGGVNTLVPSGGGSGAASYSWMVTSVFQNGDETNQQSATAQSLSNINQPSPTNPITITWNNAEAEPAYYRVYRANVAAGKFSSYGYVGTVPSGTHNFIDTVGLADFINTPPNISPFESLMGVGYYPSTVGFIQQRRVFGAWDNNLLGVAMSKPGSYYNFDIHTGTTPDDDPIFFSLAGDEVNAIQHLLELKSMLTLTSGAEILVQGNGSGIVTPSSINAATQSQYGSSTLRPLKVGDVLLFNQALGSFIRDFVFDFVIDGYRGNDITVFSSHLFEGHTIVDWAYQKIPDSIIWAVREDGVLLSCTYVREQQILAWTRHDFTNGFVENVCAIPENGQYSVYVSIRRVINGQTVRYIERLSSRIWSDPLTATYLDSFITYDGRNVGATTMSLQLGASNPTVFNIINVVTIGHPIWIQTSVPHGYSNGEEVAIAGVGGTIQLNGNHYLVTVVNGTVFSLSTLDGTPVDGTYFGLYTSGGTVVAAFQTGSTAYLQNLVLIASIGFFTTAMVGDQIFLEDAEWISSQGAYGNQVRCTIMSVITGLEATVLAESGVVPASLQATPITIWAHAIKTVSGLGYLQGQQVSVWADRYSVASPLNSRYPKYAVSSSGIVVLDKCYSVIYIGLPMTSDFETLAIDTTFGDSLLGERKAISRLILYLYNARGFFGGTENPDIDPDNLVNGIVQDPLFNLIENKAQGNRQFYSAPPSLETDWQFTNIDCNWSKEGRVFIRNVDPVPLAILAVVPAGLTSAKVAWSQKV